MQYGHPLIEHFGNTIASGEIHMSRTQSAGVLYTKIVSQQWTEINRQKNRLLPGAKKPEH